ncbi:MAG TPA: hypothetical protein VKA44_04750 [Gemmatimonadota bacterium]|nr:hypothetical protein [Gemmatimonadota bacterium]
MRRTRRTLPILGLALTLALVLPACGDSTGTPDIVRHGDIVSGTGTVRWYDLEGGFYAIRGSDGETYDPMHLPVEFQEDGLRVRFEATLRDDLASTHMVGPVVEIRSIEKA